MIVLVVQWAWLAERRGGNSGLVISYGVGFAAAGTQQFGGARALGKK